MARRCSRLSLDWQHTSISGEALSGVKYFILVLSVIHPSGFCCLQVKVETPLLSSHVTTLLTNSCCRKVLWECLPYTCAKSFSFRCVCVNLWQHWGSDALTLPLSLCLKIVKVKEKKGKKGRKKKQRKSRGQTLGQMLFSLVQRSRRISRRLQVKPDNVSGQRNIYRWHTHYSLLPVLSPFPPFLLLRDRKSQTPFLSLGKTLFWSALGSLLWLSFKRVSFLNSFLSVMLSDMLVSLRRPINRQTI